MIEVSESEQVDMPDRGLSLEERRFYEQALKAMTEEDQAILVPRYVYGYTLQQLADAHGKSLRTLNTRLHVALKRTREKLGVTVCK